MNTSDFVINVGPGGTFKPSGSFQTFPSDIDRMFLNLEKEKTKKITIYFHGGLINEKSGLESAQKFQKYISGSNQYPIFFVWETGLLETISSNIGKISGTRFFQRILRILIKKIIEKTGLDSVNKHDSTKITYAEIDKELDKEFPFTNYTKINLKNIGKNVLQNENEINVENLETEFKFLIESDEELLLILPATRVETYFKNNTSSKGAMNIPSLISHAALIAYRVIKRFIKKRDHDFYPTIIEELLREFYLAEMAHGFGII